jgi:hypothetical protein
MARRNIKNLILLLLIVILLIILTPTSNAIQNYVIENNSKPDFTYDESSSYFLCMKDGFKYIHLEGSPDEIGYLHGSLLSDYVQRSLDGYAHATESWHSMTWDQCRRQATTFWVHVPEDLKTEIEAIARGAAENGVTRPQGSEAVDWLDILTLNSMWDLWWRVSPPGNPLWWLPFGNDELGERYNPPEMLHHCSAFIATGDATSDGKFVITQSLWMPYFLSPSHAVFMDMVPDQGNRILMEVNAGLVWSGTEWYINSGGLVIAETTLGSGPYNWGKVPSFVRLRKAVQYADSIDEFKDIMLENSNGAYCGDYLIGDANTGEVAVLELGGKKWAIARTFDGFLPSCNYPWDPEVAEEMGEPQGWDHGCFPRWTRWEQLRDEYYGKITVEHAKMFIGDHYDTTVDEIQPSRYTLCGHVENSSGYPHGSMDAKATNQTLVSRMETWARFGHSCGQPFIVEDHKKEHPEYAFSDLRDIIPQPWATYSAFAKVKVVVLDGDNNPVAKANVTFISCLDGSSYSTDTDESGNAYFPYLPRSRYNVTANADEGEVREEIIISQDMDFELVLKKLSKHGFGLDDFAIWGLVAGLGFLICIFIVVKKYRK